MSCSLKLFAISFGRLPGFAPQFPLDDHPGMITVGKIAKSSVFAPRLWVVFTLPTPSKGSAD
jgi:hypothetical protein